MHCHHKHQGYFPTVYPTMGRVVIHQPNLFPRLKVLQKIVRGHVWVVLDDVQYMAQEWQNRARIRPLRRPTHEFWITLPVHRPNGRNSLIKDIEFSESEYNIDKVCRSIESAYGRSIYWNWIDAYLREVTDVDTVRLLDFCVRSVVVCLRLLGMSRFLLQSSELRVETTGTTRLVDICKRVNGVRYVAGSGSQAYLDEDQFKCANIGLERQDWIAPLMLEKTFSLTWRNISFLDFVARYGPGALKEHLVSWETH